jgi:hypothetical protein
MNSLISFALIQAAVAQTNPTWYGLIQQAANAAYQLAILDDNAKIQSVVGTVAFSAGEHGHMDAFRSLSGYSFVASSTQLDAQSYIYNISNTDASIISKTPCPGLCHNVHVDHDSLEVFTVSISKTIQVLGVENGQTFPVVDITSAVGSGTIRAGHTTHCSATKHVYVGVDNAGRQPDVIISVDLVNKNIDSVETLAFPIFTSLWASCSGNRQIGGTVLDNATSTGFFETVDPTVTPPQNPTVESKIQLPLDYAFTGLITATETESILITTLYNSSSDADPYQVDRHYMWVVSPGGPSADFIEPLDYLLVGAAWSELQ